MMDIIYCIMIGTLISISVYLILSNQLIRWLFGIVILTTTVNLIIFISGRLNSEHPPFLQASKTVNEQIANPLPQALILTAIVIGFGLLSFSLVLVRKIWERFKSLNSDKLITAEHLPKKESK